MATWKFTQSAWDEIFFLNIILWWGSIIYHLFSTIPLLFTVLTFNKPFWGARGFMVMSVWRKSKPKTENWRKIKINRFIVTWVKNRTKCKTLCISYPCLVYLQIFCFRRQSLRSRSFAIPIRAGKLILLRCKTDFVCPVFFLKKMMSQCYPSANL